MKLPTIYHAPWNSWRSNADRWTLYGRAARTDRVQYTEIAWSHPTICLFYHYWNGPVEMLALYLNRWNRNNKTGGNPTRYYLPTRHD